MSSLSDLRQINQISVRCHLLFWAGGSKFLSRRGLTVAAANSRNQLTITKKAQKQTLLEMGRTPSFRLSFRLVLLVPNTSSTLTTILHEI